MFGLMRLFPDRIKSAFTASIEVSPSDVLELITFDVPPSEMDDDEK